MGKTLNIAVFTAYFHPHEGGVENYVYNLFSRLQKDHNVKIITANTNNSLPYEVWEGFEIFRLPCHHTMDKTYPIITPEGKQMLKKIPGADIVFTNTRFFHTSLLGIRYARRNSIPCIHIEHGTMHSPIHNQVLHQFGIFYDHTIGKYIIKHSDMCIGISQESCKFIRHLYPKVNDIGLVRNSVDTKKFRKATEPQKRKMKAALGITTETVITFVGRTIYAKGIQDLLRATKDIPNIKVLIIGDGNYLGELKLEYKHAIYLGRMDHGNIIKHLSITDIFVNPSYAEGLPTSVIEAGAVGVAIIATDVGGTKEIIDDSKNGYLVKPKDVHTLHAKISELVSDGALRKKFSAEISKKVKSEYDWSAAAKALQEIINEKYSKK